MTGTDDRPEPRWAQDEDLRITQRLSHVGRWKWSIATDIVKWSEELCRICGHDPTLPVPSFAQMSSFCTPESWQRLKEVVAKALRTGEPYELELDLVRTDGVIRKTEARGEAGYDAGGGIAELYGTVQDITERKQAEQALRESEKRFRSLLVAAPVGIGLIRDHVIIEVNDTFCAMTGYAREELIGQNDRLIFPSDEEYACVGTEIYRQRDVSDSVETRFRHKAGGIVNVILSSAVLDKMNGCDVALSAQNITERKRAEEEIEALAKFPSENPTPVLRMAQDGTLLYVNPAGLGQLSEWGLCVGQAVPPVLLGPVATALQDGLWREIELAVGERMYTFFIAPIAKAGYVNLYGRDITEHKQADEDLLKSENRWRSYVTYAPYGIFVADERGRYLSVNPEACRVTGYDEGELLSMSIPDLLAAESLDAGLQSFAEMADSGQLYIELSYLTKQGETRWWSVAAVKLSPTRFLGFTEDITERKRAEEALRSSEERWRSLVSIMPDYVSLLDTEGRVLSLKPHTERFTEEDIIGSSVYQYLSTESREVLEKKIAACLKTGKEQSLEYTAMGDHGTWRQYEEFVVPVFENEKVTSIMVVARDITERKRAEKEHEILTAQLLQAQKMEAVGQLAGGVAHDFNNMLTIISGHAELALGEIDPAAPPHANLKEIRNAAQRSADLTRQLLAFARRQTIAPVVLDLNDTVESMLKMLRRLIGEDINLAWSPQTGLWPVKMDPSQIDQILANLVVNARDAIAGVGKVTIETGHAVFDEAYCAAHVGFVPGEYVVLSVSDDGSGMDEEVQQHLFEPFFTTKDVGEGTGLGLATVYGIVKQNGGCITVDSELAKGTTFRIYLPRVLSQVVKQKGTSAAQIARGRGEIVLMVEDEPSILKVLQTMLQNVGYTVLAAGSPGEAIRLAQEHAGEIDLLITDVIMPQMSGRDMAERLRASRPEMRCLFMSGYTADVIADSGVLAEGVHFIQKPCTMRDLATKVREVLDQDQKSAITG